MRPRCGRISHPESRIGGTRDPMEMRQSILERSRPALAGTNHILSPVCGGAKDLTKSSERSNLSETKDFVTLP